MLNRVTKPILAALVIVGVGVTVFSAGCVAEALPLTDGALAELVQSANPSDSASSSDNSAGRVDDSSASASDSSGLGSSGVDDSVESQSPDDSSSSTNSAAASADDGASSSGDPATGPNQRLRAGLSGTGVESGQADYRLQYGRRKFNVEVEDFAPGEYAVRINGVQVASITVGPLGTAELEFDSSVEAGHTPFSIAFPSEVNIGDIVDVAGLVSGSFVLDQ